MGGKKNITQWCSYYKSIGLITVLSYKINKHGISARENMTFDQTMETTILRMPSLLRQGL